MYRTRIRSLKIHQPSASSRQDRKERAAIARAAHSRCGESHPAVVAKQLAGCKTPPRFAAWADEKYRDFQALRADPAEKP
jgi:hypothetical protein